MPYSSTNGKIYCDRVISRLVSQVPEMFLSKKILDLGCGSGTYSDRYSNGALSRTNPDRKFRWTGVEIWEPYIEKFSLQKKYDKLSNTDAISFLNSNRDFDICFIGDLIEHMTKTEAIQLIELAIAACRIIIVSVPIIKYPQDEFEGNPYEKHVKDDWSVNEMLETFGEYIISYGVEGEIGVFVLAPTILSYLNVTLKPQIAVYAICKNEIKFVDRFYKSIQDADFISIVDTGSTDRTFEQFKYHQSRHQNMQVHQILVDPWRFDDARNVALSLLPLDADVCISIDLDEIIETGNWKNILIDAIEKDLHTIGRPADRYHHRFSTIWNWDKPDEAPNFTDHWHERIHSRTGYRWKLPVHEILVKDNEQHVRWLNEIRMTQKPDTNKPRSSYLALLEQSLKEDPSHWKSWSFYAGDLLAQNRTVEAMTAIEKARLIPDADQAYLHFQASNVYQHLRDYPKAVIEMLLAVANSNSREYRVWLARLYQSINKPREALNMMLMAEEIKERSYGYTYDPTCWGASFDDLLTQLKETT